MATPIGDVDGVAPELAMLSMNLMNATFRSCKFAAIGLPARTTGWRVIDCDFSQRAMEASVETLTACFESSRADSTY